MQEMLSSYAFLQDFWVLRYAAFSLCVTQRLHWAPRSVCIVCERGYHAGNAFLISLSHIHNGIPLMINAIPVPAPAFGMREVLSS